MSGLVCSAAEWVLVLAALVTLVRFWRGPSVFDRIACVEVLLLCVVGFLLLDGSRREVRAYFDAAVGLAVFSFIGTVFVARYLGRGELHE